MRRDDAVEDIQGITAVSVSVGIDGQAAYTSFLVGFIQCGVLRSDCILSSKRALREIISERVVKRIVLRTFYLAIQYDSPNGGCNKGL